MLYVPRAFVGSSAENMALIASFPFATLIVQGGPESSPLISHLPLIAKASGETCNIYGHFSRANPQARHVAALPQGVSATAVFQGPNAYVTPTWYQEHDVPTWNYAAVHATGTMRLVETFEDLRQILADTTDVFESASPEPWAFSLPDDLSDPSTLMRAIAGFVIENVTLTGKFKLGQNRVPADQTGVVAGLRARGDPMSVAVADLTSDRLEGRPALARSLGQVRRPPPTS